MIDQSDSATRVATSVASDRINTTIVQPRLLLTAAAVLAGTVVAMWAAAVEIESSSLWADCLLGWTLLALSWIDISRRRLPDVLTMSLVFGGLALVALTSTSEILVGHTAGVICGYLAFKAIAVSYRAVRGRDGLGGGDAKLLAAAGAWTGLGALPDIVLIGAILAIAFVIARSMLGHAIKSEMSLPFGPFLAAGLWIVRLYGPLLFHAGL